MLRSIVAFAGDYLKAARRDRRVYYFLVHNRNHVRIMADAATRMRWLGVPVQFLDIESFHEIAGARSELQSLGWRSVCLRDALPAINPDDALILGTDWGPQELIDGLLVLKERGVLLWGLIEGCRFSEAKRYRLVDRILGWGPSARECFAQPVDVVGSPAVESARLRTTLPAESPPLALINYKFTYRFTNGRDEWIAAVLSACEQAGLRCLISRHPADKKPVTDLPFADQEFCDLLPRASLVISRCSTVVHEALAAGKPVVLFPTPNEPLCEFAESRGAFSTAHTAADLPELIFQALSSASTARECSRAYLDEHFSFDPHRPASERIVAALLRRNNGAVSARRLAVEPVLLH